MPNSPDSSDLNNSQKRPRLTKTVRRGLRAALGYATAVADLDPSVCRAMDAADRWLGSQDDLAATRSHQRSADREFLRLQLELCPHPTEQDCHDA